MNATAGSRLVAAPIVALLAVLLLAACDLIPSDNRAILHTATGRHVFNVEIADTNETRRDGLMFREALAPEAGMLFDFIEERQASFWMQNTLIPLDIIFIAADGTVRTIHANARPMDTTAIPSGVPVRFVLEIPGGRAQAIGLMEGDRLEHPRVQPPRPAPA